MKPCPFCGCKPRLRFGFDEYWAECGQCHATAGRLCRTEDEAWAAWNRRKHGGKDAGKKATTEDTEHTEGTVAG